MAKVLVVNVKPTVCPKNRDRRHVAPRFCSLDSFKNMKTAKSACDSTSMGSMGSTRIFCQKTTDFSAVLNGQYATDWSFGILLLRWMVEWSHIFGIGSSWQPKYQPVDQYPCPFCSHKFDPVIPGRATLPQKVCNIVLVPHTANTQWLFPVALMIFYMKTGCSAKHHSPSSINHHWSVFLGIDAWWFMMVNHGNLCF